MMRWRGNSQPLVRLAAAALGLSTCARLATAYELDPDDPESVKSIAKDLATDMMSFYPGNQPGGIPGLIPLPYYWWEAGALMGTLIDYWYYTGDDTWNDDTTEGLLFQVGESEDYMPQNQTRTEGNDDQGFWGLAVMSAAEFKFPDPPPDRPQWLALAQAVFNTQAARWDMEHCNGGLRWQIFKWNNGFDYKNTISQACFFALGARLALYTGNHSYAEWAEKSWDWTVGVGYIDDRYQVYDGAYIQDNCTKLTPYQWTYNVGGFILGAAAMWNYTEDEVWKNRVDGLLTGAEVFFTGDDKNIMTEVACEPVDLCNIDQQSFKAYLSRWLAAITKWYPDAYDKVMPWLRASSLAATAQCKGGDNGRMCGLKWTDNGQWDGSTGLGQQMAALEVTLANLIEDSRPPVTADTGGTSEGDPAAGGSDIGRTSEVVFAPITAKDRAGAAILTMIVITGLIACVIFMMMDETADKTPAELWMDFRSAAAGGFGAVALVSMIRKKKETDWNEKDSPRQSFSVHRTSMPAHVASAVHDGHRSMRPQPTGATHARNWSTESSRMTAAPASSGRTPEHNMTTQNGWTPKPNGTTGPPNGAPPRGSSRISRKPVNADLSQYR